MCSLVLTVAWFLMSHYYLLIRIAIILFCPYAHWKSNRNPERSKENQIMKIKTKERKVIPDPIDDRKFQEWKEWILQDEGRWDLRSYVLATNQSWLWIHRSFLIFHNLVLYPWLAYSFQLLPSFFCGVFSLVGYLHLLVPFLISICNIYEKSIWNNTCNIEKRKKEKEVLVEFL